MGSPGRPVPAVDRDPAGELAQPVAQHEVLLVTRDELPERQARALLVDPLLVLREVEVRPHQGTGRQRGGRQVVRRLLVDRVDHPRGGQDGAEAVRDDRGRVVGERHVEEVVVRPDGQIVGRHPDRGRHRLPARKRWPAASPASGGPGTKGCCRVRARRRPRGPGPRSKDRSCAARTPIPRWRLRGVRAASEAAGRRGRRGPCREWRRRQPKAAQASTRPAPNVTGLDIRLASVGRVWPRVSSRGWHDSCSGLLEVGRLRRESQRVARFQTHRPAVGARPSGARHSLCGADRGPPERQPSHPARAGRHPGRRVGSRWAFHSVRRRVAGMRCGRFGGSSPGCRPGTRSRTTGRTVTSRSSSSSSSASSRA